MSARIPSRFGVPHLHLPLPSVVKRAGWQDSEEVRVSNWLTPWDGEKAFDAGLIGLPWGTSQVVQYENDICFPVMR